MFRLFKKKQVVKIILIGYHLIFTIISWFYLVSVLKETDPERFYRLASVADGWYKLFGTGSKFIIFLIYPLVKLKIAPFIISLIFSLIGLKGFLLMIDLLFRDNRIENKFKTYGVLVFLFLPTLHFWTSFISKDALLFFLMTYTLHHLFYKKKSLFQMILVLFLILMIRPYIFFILIIAFGIHFVANNAFSLKKTGFVLLGSALVGIVAFPILQSFLRLENLSVSSFQNNFNNVILYAQQNGNSSIDLAKSNYFDRFILVLFRPFLFEAIGYKQIIVAIENVVLWSVVIKSLVTTKLSIVRKQILFPALVAVLLILFYSLYMYNMGLASRMRVMFIPYLFFTLFWVLHNKNTQNIQ